MSSRELQRRLGWQTGHLRFHLDRLLEAGLVVAHAHRNTVRHFEDHGRYAGTWRQVVHLRDPEARRLHEWLLANPAADQVRIVQEAGRWGWSRARVRRRLRDLGEAGLVAGQRLGRRMEYVAAPAVPPVPGPA
jgi:predicted transcriptional regulator